MHTLENRPIFLNFQISTYDGFLQHMKYLEMFDNIYFPSHTGSHK